MVIRGVNNMLICVQGHSKKFEFLSGEFKGMVGHVSAYMASDIRKKYGKAVKITQMVKAIKKKDLNGPVISIPVSDYLKGI